MCDKEWGGYFHRTKLEKGIEAVTGMEAVSDISSSVSSGNNLQITLRLKELELN